MGGHTASALHAPAQAEAQASAESSEQSEATDEEGSESEDSVDGISGGVANMAVSSTWVDRTLKLSEINDFTTYSPRSPVILDTDG